MAALDPSPSSTAFSYAVAASPGRVVVGAARQDSTGAAYVFDRDPSGEWSQVAKLAAHDRSARDAFGWAIGTTGEIIVVGAYEDDDFGDRSGSAYVFEADPADGSFSDSLPWDDPPDIVSITAADWAGGTLTVRATSNEQCSVSLTVVGIGPMTCIIKRNFAGYELRGRIANPGQFATVDSDRGGTDTRIILGAPGSACSVDLDCDDGLFCNGAERCDGGSCLPGSPVCAANDACNEVDDLCEMCALGQPGDPCTANTECCSVNCKGKKGAKVCQ